jgi:RsiW-degrading membrane proteinase PrsW (M82 family)
LGTKVLLFFELTKYFPKKYAFYLHISFFYSNFAPKFVGIMHLMLVAALLPAFILGLYIWRRDPNPEPVKWVIRAFLAGIIICFPVAYAENAISTWLFPAGGPTTLFGTTAEAFFVAAFPEEAAKLLVLWFFVLRNNPHFDEHFDGIVYAVFVSLGFAAIENVFYVFGSGEGWASVAATRALLAVPGHYAFGILMGFYLSVYHFFDHSKKIAAKVLLVPVLAHGVYDAIAMSGQVDPIAGTLSTIVLIYFCIKLQKYAKRKIEELAA